MHTTIDYSNRPAKAFDAVEDIKKWFGPEKWEKVSPMMAAVKHCGNFAMYASLGGVQGYPVIAWYELYHGQGSWKPEELEGL